MHRFWAAAFPDEYELNTFSDKWITTYRAEILFTMNKFDEMLSCLVRFVDENPTYQLWIATSMGQAPTFAEPIKTQLYLVDLEKFLRFLGVSKWRRLPAMAPDVNFSISPEDSEHFEKQLERLTVLVNR
jgi:hypothetical protein